MSFINEQQRKLDGSRENVRKVSNAFKRKRFNLDTEQSKNDFQGNNLFDFAFKSFWIVATNDKSFVASMIVNPKGDGGDSLPLKPNMSIPFEYRQNGCAIECPAQPGVWIDIVFAYDSDITPGFVDISSSGATTITEGSLFSDGNVSITAAPVVLLNANGNRKAAIVQNVSGQPIWIGTQLNLAHADYKKRCVRLDAGETLKWKNSAQLYARVETVTTDEVVVMELS